MNRFVSRTALALVLGSGLLGAAQAAEYTQVDAAASRIAFTYKQMQVGMNGSLPSSTRRCASIRPIPRRPRRPSR